MNYTEQGSEWPTWLVILAIYGGWFSLILYYRWLPPWVANPVLVVIAAWFMSLQHELLHGHPTRNKTLNRLLGLFPIDAWYPYDLYRDSHLSHHRDPWLTTPGVDPECNYVLPQDYARMKALQRALRWSLRTMAGRFLLAPGVIILEVWADIVRAVRTPDPTGLRRWALHIALLLALLWWAYAAAGITPLHYLFGIAYPALGLASLRSFAEHRPAALPAHRIVINDAAWPWRLLYLNNNYHAVHHEQPGLAWYRIPAAYRADRAGYLQRNGGFFTPGYGHHLWKHAFKPVDTPIHPGFGQASSPAVAPAGDRVGQAAR
jgi:fatty acid desaturase